MDFLEGFFARARWEKNRDKSVSQALQGFAEGRGFESEART